jgi:NAD(P)-dependent dehydrogenase (short-subunit alcohol dehydrogenase family)
MEMQGNVFLITGGASGLGAATARVIAAQGGKVVLADMNEAAGEALAKELSGAFVKCDVSQESDGQRAVDTASSLGTLRGLVNCAGIAPAAKTVGRDGPHALDLFSKVVAVNLIGTFNMIRLAAAVMSKNETNDAGERGVIVNTASVAAYDGQIGQAAYAASKSGARSEQERHPRDDDRAGAVRNADAARHAEGSAGRARRDGAVPAASRKAGRIRHARQADLR